uniref:Uncharacterized protein n=1 Tax=Anguilla anguilla TaxID=7936 RepID=A0A0E9XFW1_ANGAN
MLLWFHGFTAPLSLPTDSLPICAVVGRAKKKICMCGSGSQNEVTVSAQLRGSFNGTGRGHELALHG